LGNGRYWKGNQLNLITHNLNQDFQVVLDRLIKEEQADTPVIHRFGPGVYIREGFMPAGALVIGHEHKTSHMNVMLKGRLLILKDDGSTVELNAPVSFVSNPGRKMAYVLEDTIWQNIHPTDCTDVEELEKVLLNKDELPFLPVDDLLLLEYAGDAEDFVQAVAEFGFSPDGVQEAMDNEEIIPFPQGSYKAVVADSLRHGKGLFASANISAGSPIAPARIDGKRTPAGRYTNHSRNPNAFAVANPDGFTYLVALREIKGATGGYLGEEITIDYRQALEVSGHRRIECQPS
jgi:hypothetical protein